MKTLVGVTFGTMLAVMVPAHAGEQSPFFGSGDTEAFQVVIDEPPALLQAEATLVGAEMTCEMPDCPADANLAKGVGKVEAP